MPPDATAARGDDAILRMEDVCVRRGGQQILAGLSLTVRRGEPFAIVGESGSGKTTLLYAAAGLVPLEAGKVELGGRRLGSLGPRERARTFGLVFQDYQLFPHLTARENVLLAPRLHGRVAEAAARRLFEELRIDGLVDRRVHELSGGQRQRVAIARSLVLEPRLLFFDEPSAALDARTSDDLAELLRTINRHTQIVVVSHDVPFIERCCGRGIRLDAGRIVQEGGVGALLDRDRPAS